MKPYNPILMWFAVGLQCLALAAICGQREMVYRGGETVFIRSVPVDPRDVFRGDTVRLEYDISTLGLELAPKDQRAELRRPGKRVYLRYVTVAGNLLKPSALSRQKPGGRFIRGYTTEADGQDRIGIRYGIEKYFVQQDQGRELERGLRVKGVRIPLEMEVAVGRFSGIAVIRGFRYAALGMEITMPPPASDRFSINIRLANASRQPIAILDTPDHAFFSIELSGTCIHSGDTPLTLANPSPLPDRLRETDIMTLAPGAVHEITLDLSQARFQLRRGDETVSWYDMRYCEKARVFYQTLDIPRLENRQISKPIWRGRLASREFSGYGIRD